MNKLLTTLAILALLVLMTSLGWSQAAGTLDNETFETAQTIYFDACDRVGNKYNVSEGGTGRWASIILPSTYALIDDGSFSYGAGYKMTTVPFDVTDYDMASIIITTVSPSQSSNSSFDLIDSGLMTANGAYVDVLLSNQYTTSDHWTYDGSINGASWIADSTGANQSYLSPWAEKYRDVIIEYEDASGTYNVFSPTDRISFNGKYRVDLKGSSRMCFSVYMYEGNQAQNFSRYSATTPLVTGVTPVIEVFFEEKNVTIGD